MKSNEWKQTENIKWSNIIIWIEHQLDLPLWLTIVSRSTINVFISLSLNYSFFLLLFNSLTLSKLSRLYLFLSLSFSLCVCLSFSLSLSPSPSASLSHTILFLTQTKHYLSLFRFKSFFFFLLYYPLHILHILLSNLLFFLFLSYHLLVSLSNYLLRFYLSILFWPLPFPPSPLTEIVEVSQSIQMQINQTQNPRANPLK